MDLFDLAIAKKLSGGGGGGGGGGLEYEEGTFTPTADVISPAISFAKSHNIPPGFVIMTIVNKSSFVGENTNVEFGLMNYKDLFGEFKRQSNQTMYGFTFKKYRDTGAYVSGTTANITTSAGISDYATAQGFTPTGAGSTFWRAGQTYRWLAVWPTE